ncbi:AMP-binding protein, partial [Mycolicibacterium elephantis]
MRVEQARAADAYRRGLWVHETLADSLRDAAKTTPQRTVLVDGDIRLDCHTLHEQATALAHALTSRMPAGSVVSFMLPNWHEAAVVYLGATLAGMVVNPILPSLRDRELQFILSDADTRAIFIPSVFGNHDYSAMLERVTSAMAAPPEVVVVRDTAAGEGAERSLPLEESPDLRVVRNVRGHTPYASLLAEPGTTVL